MPRARMIKPQFFTDSKTGTLTGDATKLFMGLLVHADDYGVIRNDKAELKAAIFPFATTAVETCVAVPLAVELIPRGLVRTFAVAGASYLFVVNFSRHQRIDHFSRPLIGGWTKNDTPETFARRSGVAEESASAPRLLDEASTTARSKVSELRELRETEADACGNSGNVENPECSRRNTESEQITDHRMPVLMDPKAPQEREELLKKQIQQIQQGRSERKGPTASNAHGATKAQAK